MSKNERIKLETALKVVEKLKANIDPKLFEVCGSVRRGCPDVGDVDLVISTENFDEFCKQVVSSKPEDLKWDLEFTKKGKLKTILIEGVKVELYVGPKEGFGALMCYATGSMKTNVIQRSIAKSKGFKLSQYGLFDSNGVFIAGATEKEVYEKLNIAYLEPKDR